MQIRVERLREALDLLAPVVPKKTNLPIITNVLLREGKAIATDLETAVILDLPEAKGKYLIPHDAVTKFLKYVPGYAELVIDAEDKKLTLSCEGSKASYEIGKVEDYPPVPKVKPKVEEKLDGDMLVSVMSSVADYCATDETKVVLTGLWLVLGEPMEVAAGDGFRLARQVLPLTFPDQQTVIIPRKAVATLADLWRKTPREPSAENWLVRVITRKKKIEIGVGNGNLKACFGRVTMVIKLIQGTPPNWIELMKGSQDPPLKVIFLAPEMETAIRRVAQVSKKGNDKVVLSWTEDSMTVSAKDGEQKAEAVIPVKAEGGNGKTAINIGYILDYLKGKDGLATMGVSTGTGPILFRYQHFPTVLIMPMHIGD